VGVGERKQKGEEDREEIAVTQEANQLRGGRTGKRREEKRKVEVPPSRFPLSI